MLGWWQLPDSGSFAAEDLIRVFPQIQQCRERLACLRSLPALLIVHRQLVTRERQPLLRLPECQRAKRIRKLFIPDYGLIQITGMFVSASDCLCRQTAHGVRLSHHGAAKELRERPLRGPHQRTAPNKTRERKAARQANSGISRPALLPQRPVAPELKPRAPQPDQPRRVS